jgi:uncharacterized membrane protein
MLLLYHLPKKNIMEKIYKYMFMLIITYFFSSNHWIKKKSKQKPKLKVKFFIR